MKRSTMNLISGTLLSAGVAVLAMAACNKRQKDSAETWEDTDMRNSKKIDRMESVDADKVPEEKGLTQLDSTYRSEWIVNGFPQTHKEMKELEKEGQKS
ncbi:hypothetical protein NSQ19_09425 [Weizmannia sp. FSL W8-1119]|uniref:hypothetical protein n=1 Tax=Weizmannia sp. FSL W8-1119 TaxID=2954709 RepID=UPI0030FC86E1